MKPTHGFATSPLQKALWHRSIEAETNYIQQADVLITGPLSRKVLERAIETVINYHEILRTSICPHDDDSEPLQVISDVARTSITWHDHAGVANPEQRDLLLELMHSAASQTSDLSQESLFRADVVYYTPDEARMILTSSAMVADKSSLNLLIIQISQLYDAFNEDLSSPAESLQFADIAEWQCNLLRESGEEEAFFWQYHSASPSHSLEMPCKSSSSQPLLINSTAAISFNGNGLGSLIEAQSKSYGLSPEAWVLAGWYAFLARLTNERQVGCGVYCNGRVISELENTIGPLANFLPLTSEINADETFIALARKVEQELVKAQQWQYAFNPGQKLSNDMYYDHLAPKIGFSFERLPRVFQSSDITFRLEATSSNSAPVHLWLDCHLSGERLETVLHYDEQTFQESDCQRLLSQFDALLRSASETPSHCVGNLNVLSDTEYEKLVIGFNDTSTDFPTDTCIHRIIERQVEQFPEAIALEFEDQQISYSKLNRRANRLAHHLKAKGIGPNVLVGICLNRSIDMVVSILAVLKAGGTYVPMDPTYPKERLEFMLADTEAPFVITHGNLGKYLPKHDAEVVWLDRDAAAIDEQPSENLLVSAGGKDLVYVIYTSGSTGKPKGVKISHEGLVISNSARIAFFKRPVKKFLLLSSFSFDSSVVGIFWSLTTGGCLLLVDERIQRNLRELNQIIANRGVSHLLTLPSYYSLILEHATEGDLANLDTSIVAGEPCPKRMVDLHRHLLPNVELYSEYGATESTVFNSVYDCRQQTLETAPIGQPIDNAEIYVLDRRLQPVPTGVTGEAYFGGSALSPGYLNRPELNAEKFVQSPFSNDPNVRLYRSGDLLRHLPNGDVEFMGRIDNQVKIRGFRIELEEIEAILLRHKSVREAAVLAIDNKRWGTANGSGSNVRTAEGKRLAAYISTEESASSIKLQMRQLIAEQLPEYMMPSAFIVLRSLPKHPNGKIDRGSLPSPGDNHSSPRVDVVDARCAEEERFVGIWKDVLGLEQVSVHDNFFELGGDSILSIQIVARANQNGLNITPMQLFQHQTIADLVASAKEHRVIHSEQGEVEGPVQLTPIHHWFKDRHAPDPSHWNMPLLLELQSQVSTDDLQAAASALLSHHDILRVRCQTNDEEWNAEIAPFKATPLVTAVDLSMISEGNVAERIQKGCADLQSSLSLKDGQLMQLCIFQLGPTRKDLLFWNLHHLAGDIVSWQILLEDLQLALNQIERGESIELPRKTTSFQYWSEQLRQYAQSAAVRQEAGFWLTEEREKIIGLPIDHENGREANIEESVRTHNVSLTKEETDELLRIVPKSYNTQINEVLLTSLHFALQKWTGKSRSLIDVELHGREENCFNNIDLSRTVGWFTSYYPLLLTSPINVSPLILLRSVKQQMRDIPSRGFHFGLLRYLQTDPELSNRFAKLPAAEINFNYLGQFGQVVQGTTLYKLANHKTTCGLDHSPKGLRGHLIDVVSWVVDDRLQIDFSYSVNANTRETVKKLAADFLETLRTLIDGSKDQVAGEDELPRSDFKSNEIEDNMALDFGWDTDDLEAIREAISDVKEGP